MPDLSPLLAWTCEYKVIDNAIHESLTLRLWALPVSFFKVVPSYNAVVSSNFQ